MFSQLINALCVCFVPELC